MEEGGTEGGAQWEGGHALDLGEEAAQVVREAGGAEGEGEVHMGTETQMEAMLQPTQDEGATVHGRLNALEQPPSCQRLPEPQQEESRQRLTHALCLSGCRQPSHTCHTHTGFS